MTTSELPRSFTAQSMAQEAALTLNRQCPNCDGAHYGWQCPEILQPLHAPDVFDTLRLRRAQIAHLHEAGLHASAHALCSDALNIVEAWIDPEAADERLEQLTAERERMNELRERTRELLDDRVEIDGVPIPF